MFPVGTKVGIKVDPFNIQIMNKPESEDEGVRRLESMNKKNYYRSLLSSGQPCLSSFPPALVFYYGLTDKSGAFYANKFWPSQPPSIPRLCGEALKLSVISTVICLLLAISACHDLRET